MTAPTGSRVRGDDDNGWGRSTPTRPKHSRWLFPVARAQIPAMPDLSLLLIVAAIFILAGMVRV